MRPREHHNSIKDLEKAFGHHMEVLRRIINSNPRGGSSGGMADTRGMERPVVCKEGQVVRIHLGFHSTGL